MLYVFALFVYGIVLAVHYVHADYFQVYVFSLPFYEVRLAMCDAVVFECDVANYESVQRPTATPLSFFYE